MPEFIEPGRYREIKHEEYVSKSNYKARSYCFTINNYTDDDVDRVLDMTFKYMVFGFEVGPENGLPHIQGYVQFENPQWRNSVKTWLPRARLVRANGSSFDNQKYCSKDGKYWEFGEQPTTGGKVTYDQIEAAMQDPDNNATIIRLYSKTYQEIKQLKIQQMKKETKFYVINPVADAITEIFDEFDGLEDPVIITELNQLGGYDNPGVVIFYEDYPSKLTLLYPRGVPIKYKYGYEWRTIKPDKFIIVTNTPGMYPLYKNIN